MSDGRKYRPGFNRPCQHSPDVRDDGFRSTRDREIYEITHSFKMLAVELKVLIIAVSNNLKSDNRAFYPALSDLRDSGFI